MSNAYEVEATFPSRGIAAVGRDGPAMYLDFVALLDPTQALRVAIQSQDAPSMLAELRRIAGLLEAQIGPSSAPH